MDHYSQKIALQGIDGLVFTGPNEVLYASADGNYTMVYLDSNRQVKVLRQLEEISQLLPSGKFCQISRSNLINMEHVIRLDSNDDAVLMTDGESLKLDRDRKMEFIEKFTRI